MRVLAPHKVAGRMAVLARVPPGKQHARTVELCIIHSPSSHADRRSIEVPSMTKKVHKTRQGASSEPVSKLGTTQH